MSFTSPLSKILLPSSSKISLNERFTKMAKVKPLKEPVTVTVKKMNPVASIKNRRLAMQMANRPSVQAALKIKKKSIKQRLGTLAKKNDPNTAMKKNNSINKRRLNLKSRLSGLKIKGTGTGSVNPSRLQFNTKQSQNKSIQSRLGQRITRTKGKPGQKFNPKPLNGRIERIGGGSGMKNRQFRQGRNNNTNRRSSGRFNQRNRRSGGFNPKAAAGAFKKPNLKKENLDMDLDQYMAKSKSHLDSDLDSYMAQAATSNQMNTI